MIASHADLIAAYEAGRFHTQRFIKTGAGQANDSRWQDWAFQAGQPPYDARIGAVGQFVPVSASGNDAIYFPPKPTGAQRMLHWITMRPQANSSSQATLDFVLYDLVGIYPLIDGDSTDPQDFSHAAPLPRYADGEGLRLVMVNHVSPAVQNGRMSLEYTSSDGLDRTTTLGVPANGINTVCSAANAQIASVIGPLTVSLGAGVTGIRRVNRVTYTVAPGGLHCLYLIKPLANFTHFHDALMQADTSGVKAALEVDFAIKDGWRLPLIEDGAHLAFFYRANGGGRITTFFGDATFVWG